MSHGGSSPQVEELAYGIQKYTHSENMQKLRSINPSNYQILGEVDVSTPGEIVQKVKLAHAAKAGWRNLGVSGRVKLLKKSIYGVCQAPGRFFPVAIIGDRDADK